MAGENEGEWAPKSREDWTGLFKDAFIGAQESIQSKRDEDEAKKAAADAATQGGDTTGKGGDGDANGGKGKRKSFAERLLGG